MFRNLPKQSLLYSVFNRSAIVTFDTYSCHSAIMGSTAIARRAGM